MNMSVSVDPVSWLTSILPPGLSALKMLIEVTKALSRLAAHARAAAEPGDLDPGILAQHPAIGRERASELGFGPRVLEVCGAALGRVVARVEQLERPAVEGMAELAQLVLVRRGENGLDQLAHRTPSTGSRRISSAVTASGCVFSTRTSSTTRRRSRASSTSKARTATPRVSSDSSRTDGLSLA